MNFRAFFFVFVLQRKTQGSRMSKHENNWYAICRSKSLLNAYAWWCNDPCQMWGWNVIRDKSRNDMFIMMLKRCLCDALYECIYGHQSPMTKDETNIQRGWLGGLILAFLVTFLWRSLTRRVNFSLSFTLVISQFN